MSAKETLHRLVNELPECALSEAERVLTLLADPGYRALMEAPETDERLTAEDIAALEEADAEIARGEGIPWEVAKAQLLRDD